MSKPFQAPGIDEAETWLAVRALGADLRDRAPGMTSAELERAVHEVLVCARRLLHGMDEPASRATRALMDDLAFVLARQERSR